MYLIYGFTGNGIECTGRLPWLILPQMMQPSKACIATVRGTMFLHTDFAGPNTENAFPSLSKLQGKSNEVSYSIPQNIYFGIK